MTVQGGADDSPFEPAFTTPQRRDSQRGYAPFLVMPAQELQTSNDVVEAGNGAPVILRWKIEDPRKSKLAIQIGLSEFHLPRFAATDVIVVHLREALLKFQSDPFPHDTDRAEAVNPSLHFRREEVSDQNLDGHSSPRLIGKTGAR